MNNKMIINCLLENMAKLQYHALSDYERDMNNLFNIFLKDCKRVTQSSNDRYRYHLIKILNKRINMDCVRCIMEFAPLKNYHNVHYKNCHFIHSK